MPCPDVRLSARRRPPVPPRDQKAECRHCGPRKLTTTSSSSSSPSVEEGRGGRQSGANRPPRKKGGFLNGARRAWRVRPFLSSRYLAMLRCVYGLVGLSYFLFSLPYKQTESLTRQKHCEFHFKLNFHLNPISSQ